MGYIGQEPSVGGYELLTISGTINGSNTSFTLNKAPATANHLMVIINGVLQIRGTGYTVSGTTLTTTSAPATGSVMSCLMLGSVYGIGKPSDGTVVNASVAAGAAIATSKLGAGAVLQVVNVSNATQTAVTTSSLVDSGLAATITPSSTSNKVLVLINQSFGKDATNTQIDANVVRGASTILTNWLNDAIRTGDATLLDPGQSGASVLDAPNTTSATTYKTVLRNAAGAGTVYAQMNNANSTITLMEIAG